MAFVEGLWSDQAVTGRAFEAIGIAAAPERSLTLRRSEIVRSSWRACARQLDRALVDCARPPTGERATSHGLGWTRSATVRAAVGVVVAVAEQVEHCPVGVRCGRTVSEHRDTSFVARGARGPHHDA